MAGAEAAVELIPASKCKQLDRKCRASDHSTACTLHRKRQEAEDGGGGGGGGRGSAAAAAEQEQEEEEKKKEAKAVGIPSKIRATAAETDVGRKEEIARV
jgi:hypothetical protein